MKLYTLLICILGSIVTYGNTFYVTNTNTSGAGSLDQAIKDVNTYPSSPTAPHIIDFSGLSGTQTLSITTSFDEILNPVNIDATTIGTYSGSPLFTINASGYTSSTSDLILKFRSSCSGSVVQGLEIIGAANEGSGDKYGIYVDDADNVSVANCEFTFCDIGIFFNNSRESLVEYCEILDYLSWGIGIWNDAYHTEIRYNEIGDGPGPCIYLAGSETIISNNTLHDWGEKCITIVDEQNHGLGQSNTVINNTLHDGNFGIEVYGTATATGNAANYNLLTQNVMYNLTSQQIYLWDAQGNTYIGNDNFATPVIDYAGDDGLITGTAPNNARVELFTADDSKDALSFLGSTVADASGNWTYNHQTSISTVGVTALAINLTNNNTSEMDYEDLREVDVAIEDTCTNCVGSFTLVPEEKYLITAWVHEEDENYNLTTFANGKIYLDFDDGSSITTLGAFVGEGQIIDGWQRIEAEFTVPANAISMSIRLQSASGDVFFDDIRILPFDGSMKSYVYDPIFMRLMAEMDERHYATFYEYDEEGKLIRIKKETEKGIMTIQETRNNNSK